MKSFQKKPRVRGPNFSGLYTFARVKKFGTRAVACVSLFLSVSLSPLCCFSDVSCSWDGTSWTCSGEGSGIVVGPGGSGGGVLPPETVITNYIGVCTNCSNIAPSDLRDLVDAAKGQNAQLAEYAAELQRKADSHKESIESNLTEIATYQTWTVPSVATNYAFSTQNSQAEGMRQVFNSALQTGNTRNYQTMGAGNGIYYYANNSVAPHLQAQADFCDTAWSYAGAIISESQVLDATLDTIRAGAVECMGDANSPTNDPSGTVSGNWCTKDQGNAITNLLNELKAYLKKVDDRLVAQTNYQRECRDIIRSGLFTDYNAIPPLSQLGGNWQEIYLDGNETNWGYQPTNILARIELLLYGMSQVGTNQTAFSDESISSTEAAESFDDAKDNLTTTFSSLTTDLDGRPYQSLGDSLIGFFRSFEYRPQPLYADTTLIDSFTVSEQSRDGSLTRVVVPAIRVGAETVGVFNSMSRISSTMFTAIYLVFYGYMVFLFWRGYSLLAVKFFQWIIQIIQSFLT